MFQSRRCVSLGQVLKDGGMPVSRLAFGPQVVIRYMHGRTVHLKAKNDVSPYPLHLRAEKRDRVRPCLQRPCRWALHVYTIIKKDWKTNEYNMSTSPLCHVPLVARVPHPSVASACVIGCFSIHVGTPFFVGWQGGH